MRPYVGTGQFYKKKKTTADLWLKPYIQFGKY